MIVCGKPRVNIVRWVNMGQACATVSFVSYIFLGIVGVMNPNYLSKDELECELRVRGFFSFVNVRLLRKRVRSATSSFLPSQPQTFFVR
jgi:hypothetical protein